ncbi:MAG: hypothetical protein M3Z92_05100 [Bacteroidota bacterium]|nr:hypothetical protein [Bacteroidota bacterium]MDQ6889352.1 hypothetical protein [Bacteroidota bacterium]
MRATGLMEDAPGETFKIVDGIEYRKGDEVRLKLGQRRSDAMDMLLDNKIATIEIIYIDYEDKVYLAVTMNDDPGQDMARELGRYLFFSPDEVEHIK